MVKLTPSTASTRPPARRRKPWGTAKCCLRSSTSRTGRRVPGRNAAGVPVASAGSVIPVPEQFARAPARRPMPGSLLLIGRVGGAAAVFRMGAARREGAADRQLGERRHHAGYLLKAGARLLAGTAHQGEPRNR